MPLQNGKVSLLKHKYNFWKKWFLKTPYGPWVVFSLKFYAIQLYLLVIVSNHKTYFSNPCIFATWWCFPLIFQTLIIWLIIIQWNIKNLRGKVSKIKGLENKDLRSLYLFFGGCYYFWEANICSLRTHEHASYSETIFHRKMYPLLSTVNVSSIEYLPALYNTAVNIHSKTYVGILSTLSEG